MKTLSEEQSETLLGMLRERFESHMGRHPGLEWEPIQAKLAANPEKLASLQEMERTSGEPDVIGQDEQTGAYLFYDCSVETPEERRSLCYDGAALASRKENKPRTSAVAMAESMGIELLTEAEYRALQGLEKFDTKTSSWLKTPPEIRKLGGAIFGDRRYNTVFVYHNGASSYYAGRGFRGVLKV